MNKPRSLHLAIETLEAGTKAARLRILMPDIEERLTAGARISDLVRTLTENGLPISTATLKSYLYRFRKAARESSSREMKALDSYPQVVDVRSTLAGVGGSAERPNVVGATTTPGLLRHINTARCLRLLKRGATFSRAELARELCLTRATIGKAIKELIESGLVVQTAERAGGTRPGRPGSGLSLNPEGAYSIGIEVSSIALTGVLVDLGMSVVHRIHVPTGPHLHNVEKAVEQIAQLPEQLMAARGIDPKQIYGMCVSAPGLVDQAGRIVVAPFLRWRDVPLKQLLTDRPELPWPVTVCNDAVAFANAELAVAGEDEAQNMLLILLSEGLGGAIVQRGQIFQGAHGYAGELGHMVMGATPGAIATQSFELLAGYERFRPFLPADRAFEEGLAWLASSQSMIDDPGLESVYEGWAQALATGMLNLIYLLDPGKIVFGGPLSILFPRIESRVQRLLSDNLLHGFPTPPLYITRFGTDGACIGAASVVRDQIFALPQLEKTQAQDRR